MSKSLRKFLYAIIPILLVAVCAGMITFIFAATKTDLSFNGQIGYFRPRGSGTVSDPYLIYDIGPNSTSAKIGDFNYYAGKNTEGKNYFSSTSPKYYFKQMNDISGTSITQTNLYGFYDGGGYSFDCTSAGTIFKNVGSSSNTNSYIKNLKIKNYDSNDVILTDNLYGTIEKVEVYGKIDVGAVTVYGSLVSNMNSGTIKNCVNYADLIYDSEYESISSYLNLSAGGLVGVFYGGTIKECANFGNINVKDFGSAGGIVGKTDSEPCSIIDCYNAGSVVCLYDNGKEYGSGIGSTLQNATITNCYNLGDCMYGLTANGNSELNVNNFYCLEDCGATQIVKDDDSYNDSFKSLADLQQQDTYSGFTFGTYGSATSGWCMVPSYIKFSNRTQSVNVPRLWFENIVEAETVTISFAAGEGSGTTTSQTMVVNAPTKIKSSTFTSPSGKGFAGWALEFGGPIAYYPGDEVKFSSDTILYAIYDTLGTKNAPYEIASVADFNKYATSSYFGSSNRYYFKQVADISAGSTTLTVTNLYGYYDGGGHTIDKGTTTTALFSYIGSSTYGDASLTNLNVVRNSGTTYGICQYLYGVMDNVTFTGTANYGGFARYICGGATIKNSINYGTITGSVQYLGGCFAQCSGVSASKPAIIDNCYNYGPITSTYASNAFYVGGIIASTAAGLSVTNCKNFEVVKINNNTYNGCIGGIVGNNASGSSVTDCSNFGEIIQIQANSSSRFTCGGIVGTNSGTITGCANTGVISNGNRTGGIAGYSTSNTSITNCYNTANITANNTTNSNNYVGGIVGECYAKITDCYNSGNINAYRCAGGIVGIMSSSSSVTNCYNTGSVTTSYTTGYTGGIVGSGNYPISYCYNLGTLTCNESSTTIGGLIGYSGSSSVTISNSYWCTQTGVSNAVGNRATLATDTSRTETQLRTQSTYSNWTFGTTGTATTGWIWPGTQSILINGELKGYSFPRLWFEFYESSTTESVEDGSTLTFNIDIDVYLSATDTGSGISFDSRGYLATTTQVSADAEYGCYGSATVGINKSKVKEQLVLYDKMIGTCFRDYSITFIEEMTEIYTYNIEFWGVTGDLTLIIMLGDVVNYEENILNNYSNRNYAWVDFMPNGGTGFMESQVYSGSSQALTTATFINGNKIFKGWALSPNGNIIFTDGETISPTNNLKLYAVWGYDTVTVSVTAPNGGLEITITYDGVQYNFIPGTGYETMEIVIGSTISIRASELYQGYFNGWEIVGENTQLYSTDYTYQFTVNEALTIKGYFVEYTEQCEYCGGYNGDHGVVYCIWGCGTSFQCNGPDDAPYQCYECAMLNGAA